MGIGKFNAGGGGGNPWSADAIETGIYLPPDGPPGSSVGFTFLPRQAMLIFDWELI